MTPVQRRRLASVTAVLLLVTAGLIALSVSAAAPATGGILASTAQHHLTVPSPIRAAASQHGTLAVDAALLGPGLLLGLGLVGWLRRRPHSERPVPVRLARPSSRGPPAGY